MTYLENPITIYQNIYILSGVVIQRCKSKRGYQSTQSRPDTTSSSRVGNLSKKGKMKKEQHLNEESATARQGLTNC